MVEPAGFCILKQDTMTPEEAEEKLSLNIPGFPPERFAYIDMEDIKKNKYFITSYGRVFTSYGRELFPDYFRAIKLDNWYMRIELSCSTYYKLRKFFIHRLVANAFIPRTEEDVLLGRHSVNHKFNKDGRCNYVWNLEWTTISENTLHGLYFNESYDSHLFDFSIITNRRDELVKNITNFGENNSKSRVTEFQVRLICYAFTVLGYNLKECAIYAWLKGDNRDILLVSSIVNGYAWHDIVQEYGIMPKKQKRSKTNAKRPDKKKEYDEMKSKLLNK